jgi:transcriptional regulator with PAS, ATPase and Fis domain
LSTVLIQGASGTGKELFARAIHDLSPRADGPFVAINCGALPDALLESELFGYKAGAFTDARNDKLGRLALADGGTIFLDEIGDVSPAVQSKLLRALQSRTFEPLGGVDQVHVDVRVIAATNKDLGAMVQQGSFREDFFYRIAVFRLDLPALCERREDIPLLVDHFLAKLNQRQGKYVSGVADETMAVLLEYDFPGNVRELENIVEHAFVLCECEQIQPCHLPATLRPCNRVVGEAWTGLSLAEVERRHIVEALRRNEGNRHAAARQLGIHPSTLFRKIKRLDIEMPATPQRRRR